MAESSNNEADFDWFCPEDIGDYWPKDDSYINVFFGFDTLSSSDDK